MVASTEDMLIFRKGLKMGNSFDSAALAGTTLAVTLAVFTEPGPYDLMSGIIGSTLLVIVLAYEGVRERTWPQSLALSMVLALAALLPICVVLEWSFGGNLNGRTWHGINDTAIPDATVLWTWFLLAIMWFALEKWWLQDLARRAAKANGHIVGVAK